MRKVSKVLLCILLPVLFVVLNTQYARAVDENLQHGDGSIQNSSLWISPIATWLTIKMDFGGPDYYWALLYVGGAQWALIGLGISALVIWMANTHRK